MMFEVIHSQILEKKESLKAVEDRIRRITGRDPNFFAANRNMKFRNQAGFGIANRMPMGPMKNFNKRRYEDGEIEEEEEEEEEIDETDVVKPSLQSAVVTTQKNPKTRRETIAEQKGDKKTVARDRRMFGMMLGTLQKFQSEETIQRRNDKMQKRAEIEKKVEEAAEKEKETMKKEKSELFNSRREQQVQIRCLEKKAEVAELFAVWEKSHKHFGNFILTNSEPQIMCLPAKLNPKTEKCLEESKKRVEDEMQAKRAKVMQELLEIDEAYNRAPEVMDIGDKENLDQEDDGADTLHSAVDVSSTKMSAASDSENTMTELPEKEMVEPKEGSISEDSQPIPVGDNDEFEPIYD